MTGVYVVTRLVANSLNERLTNQLLEAGRVVSDGMARQDVSHLEAARLLAFTTGLAEALQTGDTATLEKLAIPLAGGLEIENLILISANGQEALHLKKSAAGSFEQDNRPSGAQGMSIVQALLAARDPESLPLRGFGKNPLDGRYYYYTAMPVFINSELIGVIVAGTSFNTLLPYLKSTSLADIIIYADGGQAIATTLSSQSSDPAFIQSLSITPQLHDQLLQTRETVSGETIEVDRRSFSLARASLRVSSQVLGSFAVVLPLNFVIQSGVTSRDTYIVIFTLAMVGVVFIGFSISRGIINPLNSLIHTSRAIAGGDLTKRSGIDSKDEIGILAQTFDEMTVRLEERTAELERTYRTLEQLDQAKVNFIAVAAHELRTPLTLLKGYTQMLQIRSQGDPEQAALTQGILDGYERMVEIVNSMLDVSKIDSNTLKLIAENTHLGLLLIRVQKTFKDALKERNIKLELRNLDDLPTIQADPDLLYKVFYHLVINAIKFTPDGGQILVSGRLAKLGETPAIEIIVRDTGIGIDAQHQQLVFEKFYQTGEVHLHSSGRTKFKGGGPGLGLAIARGIVEAHKGKIWVESPGHDETSCPGSSFHVSLPIGGGPA